MSILSFVFRSAWAFLQQRKKLIKNILFKYVSLNFICRPRKQLSLALFTLHNTFQSCVGCFIQGSVANLGKTLKWKKIMIIVTYASEPDSLFVQSNIVWLEFFPNFHFFPCEYLYKTVQFVKHSITYQSN